ncbi:hypothetical protein K435DRAFT_943185 [Dendrothele bispora CBS 962.96]|uniref:Uncharacterized protein n=1 Tax=Dendrothele bispora (strain CBS 962.96) TaxID=1314807 RepID=A0A4S8KUJ2_DENBC|nr:hypothetical protein K435DRAFT_943185 [Dendrothele bispora CBS 962.96]
MSFITLKKILLLAASTGFLIPMSVVLASPVNVDAHKLEPDEVSPSSIEFVAFERELVMMSNAVGAYSESIRSTPRRSRGDEDLDSGSLQSTPRRQNEDSTLRRKNDEDSAASLEFTPRRRNEESESIPRRRAEASTP